MDFKHYLDSLLNPKTVVVVGASDNQDSLGYGMWRQLKKSLKKVSLYPVNSKYKKIEEEKCYPSVADIKDDIDLVVVVSEPSTYEKTLNTCIKQQVKSILLCGGFPKSEITKKITEKVAECAAAGIHVVGPHSLGFIRPSLGLNASFLPDMPATGNIGLISQSPGLDNSIIDIARENKAGFSFVVDPGLEQELLTADYVDMLASDPETDTIVLYLETFKNPRKLLSAIRYASKTKPVILLKGGRTSASADIVVNNNGSGLQYGSLMERALERAGALLIDTVQDLYYITQGFAYGRRFTGGAVFGLVNSKGLDTLLADSLSKFKVPFAQTTPTEAAVLETEHHVRFPYANPINVGLDAEPKAIAKAASYLLGLKSCGGLIIALATNPSYAPEDIAKELMAAKKKFTKPVVTVWLGAKNVRKAVTLLQTNEIPALYDIEGACMCVGLMERFYEVKQSRINILQDPPLLPNETFNGVRKILQKADKEKRNLIYEDEAKRILASIGFEITSSMPAGSVGEAAEAAKALGYPVTLKLRVDGILSKSDIGGVIVGIRNERELKLAWKALEQRAEQALISERDFGAVVQSAVSESNLRELKVGFRTTEQFGPVVYIGVGGLYGNIGFEEVYGFIPLSHSDAMNMLSSPTIKRLIAPYKGLEGIDQESLCTILLNLSQLASAVPALKSLDVDPLLCGGTEFIVLDAHAVTDSQSLEADEKQSHLIFPNRNNLKEEIVKGEFGELILRGAEPADAKAFEQYLGSLSENSRQQRFHGVLSNEVLVANTLISDPDRSICMFLIDPKNEQESIVAEAMFSILPNGKSAEFGISARDSWQRKGLSSPLMSALEENARRLGIEELIGYVRKDNTAMKKMMSKRGYRPRPDETDPHITLYILDMQNDW